MIAVLDTLSTRLKSPYFGSFALAWFASTWQVWYVTLFVSINELPRIPGTDMRYTDKLSYIWSLKLGWCRLLFVPVLIGFITPVILHFVEGLLSYMRKHVDQHWAKKDDDKFKENAYVTRKEKGELSEQLKEALAALDTHRTDAFKYRKKFEDCEYELQTSRDGAANLQKQLEETTGEFTRLTEAAKSANQLLESQKRRFEELKTECATLQNKVEEQQKDSVSAEQQYASLREQTNQRSLQTQDLLSVVARLTKENEEFQDREATQKVRDDVRRRGLERILYLAELVGTPGSDLDCAETLSELSESLLRLRKAGDL